MLRHYFRCHFIFRFFITLFRRHTNVVADTTGMMLIFSHAVFFLMLFAAFFAMSRLSDAIFTIFLID